MTTSLGPNHAPSQRARRVPVLASWRRAAAVLALSMAAHGGASATTTLSDAPVFYRSAILGNVALALSVEWPTASRAAYPGTTDYSSANTYRGYFDPNKCYLYNFDAVEANRYFYPAGNTTTRTCLGADDNKWSGNYLNWAATQAIDPFRWAMTGGNRVVDTLTETRLQKAWHSGQGNLFPNKNVGTSATVAGATPFAWSRFRTRIDGVGFQMLFTGNSTDVMNNNTSGGAMHDVAGVIAFNPAVGATDANAVYAVSIRLRVCDSSAAAGGVESNCTKYGSNWKPEGLMQQYAQRLRFAAFGYLNQDGNDRDGAVMRARMKFVGPNYPVPGAPNVTNATAEWDPSTGVFAANPDSTDAAATNAAYAPTVPVVTSGVANYLNKFGQINTGNYKGNDPVGELYYSAQRYFRNLGAVGEWNTLTGSSTAVRALDGFPVVRQWDDPIQYACQKNFILGIGDIYTHADKHLPGATNNADEVVGMPGAVSADTAVNAVTATNIIGQKQGLGSTLGTQTNVSGGCCSNNSMMMAGLAYWANVNDIRPDVAGVARTQGKQTIQTLWVDVLEQPFVANNTYYMTAKYGGFTTPANLAPPYNYSDTSSLPQTWWSTTGETLTDTRGTGTTQPRPDGYFTAGNPDQMISGLTRAFARINALSAAFTTSFSTSLPQVTQLGNASFGAQYDASNWTGEVVASELNFATDGTPGLVERWRATTKLAAQIGGTGWNINRNVVTWNGTAGVPFRLANLTATQSAALDTPWSAVDDRGDYLNYLRGDRTHETDSTATGSSRSYRKREALLGDIVGARAKPVGPPAFQMTDDYNPGYEAFKTTYKNRTTMVYVGANDGMLHAFNGSLSGTSAGREVFAYVPNAVFAGPSSPSTPSDNGLAALGNPDMDHRYFVNATPAMHDVDFTRTWNGSSVGTGTADWRTILVGGLGKGGRSYYALDITNPTTISSETDAAAKVLWEFTAPEMGFGFGEPAIVKTRKYGWTVIIPSGYNTPDGRGYLFFVNPRTGALLEPPVPTRKDLPTETDTGLAHVNAYVVSYRDGYADSVYGGDLHGRIWRFDLTATSGKYPEPELFARLADSSGTPQPVTTRPLAELHPKTRDRFLLVGTGRLLNQSDMTSSEEQSFYAIKDGNEVRFNRATDLPAGVSFPIQRNRLVANQNWVTGFTGATTTTMGFYTDLGRDFNNIAWRVVSDPSTFRGNVAFSATLPSLDDPCSPSGRSRIYVGDFQTGISTLITATGAVLNFYETTDGVVTDVRFLSVGGKPRLIIGTDRGAVRQLRGEFGSAVGLRRINWREVQVGN